MNKITISEDNLTNTVLTDDIQLKFIPKNPFFDVNTLELTILKSCSLDLNFKTMESSKLNLKITTLENANLDLQEYKVGETYKVKYHFEIGAASHIDILKFNNLKEIKEFMLVNLNGQDAKFNYNFKTIATGYEKYDLNIYHNAPKTTSLIKNNGVNMKDGNLIFNVSSFVSAGNKDCNVDQISRIINLTNNKCQINPNLFIDEFDVNANHSALIGKFSDEEMFYMQSRGIDEKSAVNLLINGFLTSEVNELFKERIINTIQEVK